MATAIDVPVLVVGAGPAGLTASLLLARHGIDALSVDRRSKISPLARARGVHVRAMEIMRVCGVEPALRAVELPIQPGAVWQPSLAEAAIREDTIGPATEVSPCEGLALSQDVLEAVLLDHVRSEGDRVLLGTELEDFDVVDEAVDARLRDRATGDQLRVRARFMIGADGVRSAIRQRLGVDMAGAADLGTQRAVWFRADLSRWTGDRPRGIYFMTDAGAALIWTHPDYRWVLNLPAAAGDTREPTELVRRSLGIDDLPVEIVGDTRWTAAAQSAQRYSEGPIFLLGDAAHRFPPVGAMGVSAAMHDAHNLAWKIAAVLRGRANECLLDSYADERQPVGARIAEEAGAAWAQVLSPTGTPFAGRSLRQLDMGYQYRSPVVVDDGSPDADPSGSDYAPNAAPGCRAPHLWIGTARGRRSTIDLFDRDFVLLTTAAGVGWRKPADRLGLELTSHVIAEPEWPSLYGVTESGAVLVRPDGHVAWRHGALPDTTASTISAEDLLSAAFRAALCAPPGWRS